ncbi:MAG: heavy metal translocating P-type ATPase [Fusobacteriaceae bacterium]
MFKKNNSHNHSHDHFHGHENIAVAHSHTDSCGSCACGTLEKPIDSHDDENKNLDKIKNFILLGSMFLFAISFGLKYINLNIIFINIILIISYLLVAYDVFYYAIKNLVNGNFLDENFLMAIASVGAIAINQIPEAVAVMIFYKVGEHYQEKAVNNSRRSIKSLLELKPEFANLKLEDGSSKKVPPESIKVSDIILVRNGERIPLDGVVVSGNSFINAAAITGESLPIEVKVGSALPSGAINEGSLIELKVEKIYSESTVNKIIEMVQNATSKKPVAEKFITKFAKVYTPMMVGLAILIAVVPPLFVGDFKFWLYRALILLVISCPCALVLSIPLTFFSTIGYAAKRGILIKGGQYLEKLTEIKAIIFDKTGTLTHGNFIISKIISAENSGEQEILEIAKAAESHSNHPIAKVILDYNDSQIKINQNDLQEYEEIAGKGVCAKYKGEHIMVGNKTLMQNFKIDLPQIDTNTKTVVFVAKNKKYIGSILIADEIKITSRVAIENLKKYVSKIFMLTGDNKEIGFATGKEIGLDRENIFAELLPQDKMSILNKIKSENPRGVIFVGDGINDAPTLAQSDIGIAMGKIGSDIAIESSDIVLMNDDPMQVYNAISLAHKNKRILKENIIFIFAVKAIIMVLGVLGIANLWMAIFGDVGVSILAVLNSAKILKHK